jgi:hypothetical protein
MSGKLKSGHPIRDVSRMLMVGAWIKQEVTRGPERGVLKVL